MNELGKTDKSEYSFESFQLLIKEVLYITRYWATIKESELPKANVDFDFATKLSMAVWRQGYECKVYDKEMPSKVLGVFQKENIKTALQTLAKDFPESYKAIITNKFDFYDADVFFQTAVLGKITYPK